MSKVFRNKVPLKLRSRTDPVLVNQAGLCHNYHTFSYYPARKSNFLYSISSEKSWLESNFTSNLSREFSFTNFSASDHFKRQKLFLARVFWLNIISKANASARVSADWIVWETFSFSRIFLQYLSRYCRNISKILSNYFHGTSRIFLDEHNLKRAYIDAQVCGRPFHFL